MQNSANNIPFSTQKLNHSDDQSKPKKSNIEMANKNRQTAGLSQAITNEKSKQDNQKQGFKQI